MRMNRVCVLLTVLLWGLLINESAFAFYNPSTGRWLNRDPMDEAGGLNLCGFTRNDSVNRIDMLGLAELQWQHNDCQGCNGPGHTMGTLNTCEKAPAGKYVAGASGAFNTSCSQNKGILCDTETHVFIRAGRGMFCGCKKWKVTCEFNYDGKALGDEAAGIYLKVTFLGKLYKFFAGAFNHGPEATITKSFSLSGVVSVNYWGWTEIAKMVPESRAEGSAFHTINESGSISCSGKCAD